MIFILIKKVYEGFWIAEQAHKKGSIHFYYQQNFFLDKKLFKKNTNEMF